VVAQPFREEIRVPGAPEPVGVGTYAVTVFYRNIADREAVNRVRREYFGLTRPASIAVEVSRLVKDDLLVEIEVIAVRPPAA
jgi:enamine deaminase RidA (YjgF/YER057c/UK114 family)